MKCIVEKRFLTKNESSNLRTSLYVSMVSTSKLKKVKMSKLFIKGLKL